MQGRGANQRHTQGHRHGHWHWHGHGHGKWHEAGARACGCGCGCGLLRDWEGQGFWHGQGCGHRRAASLLLLLLRQLNSRGCCHWCWLSHRFTSSCRSTPRRLLRLPCLMLLLDCRCPCLCTPFRLALPYRPFPSIALSAIHVAFALLISGRGGRDDPVLRPIRIHHLAHLEPRGQHASNTQPHTLHTCCHTSSVVCALGVHHPALLAPFHHLDHLERALCTCRGACSCRGTRRARTCRGA